MRRRLVVAGVLMFVATLAPTLAFAAPGPVSGLTVVPWTSSASTGVTLSWTYSDPSATGAVMCAKKGDQPALTPDACDIKWAKSQGETTGSLTLAQGQTYSFSVFAYAASGGQRDYAPPETTAAWDGVHLEFPVSCMRATYGQPCQFKAVLTDTYLHGPASGATLELWQDSVRHATDQTNIDGKASIAVALRKPASMQWRFQGGDNLLGAFTDVHGVNVAYKLTAHLTEHAVTIGKRVKMYGVVRPDTSKQILVEEMHKTRCGTAWDIIGRVGARQQRLPNGQTTYGYIATLTATAGKQIYRAYAQMDNGVQMAYSPEVTLTGGAVASSRAERAFGPARPSQSVQSLHRLRSC